MSKENTAAPRARNSKNPVRSGIWRLPAGISRDGTTIAITWLCVALSTMHCCLPERPSSCCSSWWRWTPTSAPRSGGRPRTSPSVAPGRCVAAGQPRRAHHLGGGARPELRERADADLRGCRGRPRDVHVANLVFSMPLFSPSNRITDRPRASPAIVRHHVGAELVIARHDRARARRTRDRACRTWCWCRRCSRPQDDASLAAALRVIAAAAHVRTLTIPVLAQRQASNPRRGGLLLATGGAAVQSRRSRTAAIQRSSPNRSPRI